MWFEAKDSHLKKEKARARELRHTSWWKEKIQAGICYYCGQSFSPEMLTMDHKLPVSQGGHSDKNNCVPACKSCNTEKKNQSIAEFLSSKKPTQFPR